MGSGLGFERKRYWKRWRYRWGRMCGFVRAAGKSRLRVEDIRYQISDISDQEAEGGDQEESDEWPAEGGSGERGGEKQVPRPPGRARDDSYGLGDGDGAVSDGAGESLTPEGVSNRCPGCGTELGE